MYPLSAKSSPSPPPPPPLLPWPVVLKWIWTVFIVFLCNLFFKICQQRWWRESAWRRETTWRRDCLSHPPAGCVWMIQATPTPWVSVASQGMSPVFPWTSSHPRQLSKPLCLPGDHNLTLSNEDWIPAWRNCTFHHCSFLGQSPSAPG